MSTSPVSSTSLREDGDLGTPWLRLERRGSIAWCVVDRPEARNAMTPDMYRGISRAIDLATNDPELRAMVLTGTDPVFVPGGDISRDSVEAASHSELPFGRMRDSPLPIIAAVNGICQASGLLLALLSDLAVASDRATFRAPELHAGFPDTWLGAVLPVHVGMTRARDLMLTARWVDADEAGRIGLVSRVVAHDRLEEEASAAVSAVLRAAPSARLAWKQAANTHYGVVDQMTFDAGVRSAEAQEGFNAIKEKRLPAWVPDHDV